jgi:RNA polymerase sigma-70 factor (ECF subfamily)
MFRKLADPVRNASMHSSERVWRERCLRSAVLAGDERAWTTWYEESFAGLHAYVGWRCAGLLDLTDEIVQETWLTAVRRIRRFDPEQGTFGGWLRGIAANVLRNHFRRDERRNGHLARLRQQRLEAADGAKEQERAEQIARTLAELPQRYEAVLQAKYLDGLSVAQIAETWGESPKAIESLLTRARQAFREAYQQVE